MRAAGIALTEIMNLISGMKLHIASLVCLLTLLSGIVLARDAREQRRIDFLIQSVETSKGIVFIRNASEHDGRAAAAHLRMKLNYAGERVKTAEDFVKYCASESSLTHRKYRIRLPDGTTTEAATYFAERLREFDQQK